MRLPVVSVLNLTAHGEVDVIVTGQVTIKTAQNKIRTLKWSVTCNGFAPPGNTAAISLPPSCEIIAANLTADRFKGTCIAGIYAQAPGSVNIMLLFGCPSNQPITWPIPSYHGFEWPSIHKTYANPAAGANAELGHDSGTQWENWIVKCRLVTGAAAANRRLVLDYTDPIDGFLFRSVAPADQVASTTIDYVFAPFGASQSANNVQLVTSPNPTFGAVYSGGVFGRTLNLNVTNIQAADQLSAIILSGTRKITTA